MLTFQEKSKKMLHLVDHVRKQMKHCGTISKYCGFSISQLLIVLTTRELSPPARYRLPTPGNCLRNFHLDCFAIRVCFTCSPYYDSQAKIAHKLKFGICIIVHHSFSPT